jgi:hypothetical protein
MSRNAILEKLAEWRPQNDRDTLQITADGWSAAIIAECVDVVGSRLWELSLRPTPVATAVDLQTRAEQICARATGLLEPLRVVEVDAPNNTALLRSERPGQVGDERFYYELLLSGDGGSVLRRYQAPQENQPRRQQVPFTLTHEALGKLVGDLTR